MLTILMKQQESVEGNKDKLFQRMPSRLRIMFLIKFYLPNKKSKQYPRFSNLIYYPRDVLETSRFAFALDAHVVA